MSKRALRILRGWALVGAIVLGLAWLLYACLGPTNLRYRLTLYFDVDGKPIEASNVTQLLDNGSPSWGQSVFAEALTLDLGARGVLAVPFANPNNETNYWAKYIDRLESLLPESKRGDGDLHKALRNVASLPEGTGVDLPFKELPMLVRFPDRNDPHNVAQVDPFDLEKSFGPGVRLLRARLSITHAPVTSGIQKVLPWLSTVPNNTEVYCCREKLYFNLNYSAFRTMNTD